MKFATKTKFYALCERSGLPEIHTIPLFEEVVSMYAEEHRNYHDLKHIDRSLGLHAESGVPDDALELAIWFHHVIYDPKVTHNERKSADYFEAHFDNYLWPEALGEVERLIMATDPMIPRRGTNRENLMIDLDLSILGAEPAEYQEYCQTIREEYSFVSEPEYCEGRIKMLENILEDEIFATERFMNLEPQARSNITKELKKLKAYTYYCVLR